MSKKLKKSLQDFMSTIQKPSPHIHHQFPSNTISSSKQWSLRGCQHPKTLAFALINRDRDEGSDDNNDSAKPSDVDRFLFENFKSLYIKDGNEEEICARHGVRQEEKSPGGRSVLFESPRFVDTPPDLCGSNRFFVTIGLSNSLIEEAQSSGVTNTTTSTSEQMDSSTSTNTGIDSTGYGGAGGERDQHVKSPSIPSECTAVFKYSPNPYGDFRGSMQQMVEARLRHHSTIDWDFMEELLFCYLSLNDEKSYKFILSAFIDLIKALRQNDRKIPVRSRRSKLVVRDAKSRRTRHNNVT